MKKVYTIFLIVATSLVYSQVSFSGCNISGAMLNQNAVAGCGNGGANYCNLSALYVPVFSPTGCSTVVLGGGTTDNYSTVYSLPAGCTATITAQYMKRNYLGAPTTTSAIGCSNSGMDSGDDVFITNTGGIVSAQGSTMDVNVGTCGSYTALGTYTTGTPSLIGGCANSDGTVQMILTGGSFNIGGKSNRSDEIITFTVNLSGTCGPSCSGVLPIILKDFYAEPLESEIILKWSVETEKNVLYYLVEKSLDGIEFSPLNTVYSLAITNQQNSLSYFTNDRFPSKGINYYRLMHVENDGSVEVHKTIAVNFKSAYASTIWVNQTKDALKIGYEKMPLSKSVFIYDITGRKIKEVSLKMEAPAENEVFISDLVKGIYLISGSDPQDAFSQKLIIQ
ncbi:T9SS type A sorting domain-containing protein [Sediminibacterium sp.]|uniref:T9SS type A sorting domain-containing protein n=1 Tax=Sediminibacterium sp. TaxID=1917865 RepID=UPI00273751B5|nr:T9SS type A sorting domain-containing protein [Sediminibacterium sp.]MDP3567588.1 T9SS type A sorting domain-containing protein [Sediminibacterium sp.]